jgi:hypothetical protein
MVFLSLLKLLPGRSDRSLVLLLPTEHTAQPSHRLGFEVSPFRSWNRNGKIPQVQRRHSNTAPERIKADLGIARE